MKTVYVITHPEVVIDPNVPVPRWPLSQKGRARMQGLLSAPWIKDVKAVYSSEEQKAVDGAFIIAQHLGLTVSTIAGIGEGFDEEDDSLVFKSDVKVSNLSDNALRSWIATFLLGAPSLGGE